MLDSHMNTVTAQSTFDRFASVVAPRTGSVVSVIPVPGKAIVVKGESAAATLSGFLSALISGILNLILPIR